MITFEYEQRMPQRVEYVNGVYELHCLKQLRVQEQEVLYCLGEAELDNSCCGLIGVSYALVIGEIVTQAMRKTPDGNAVSLIRQIQDAQSECKIRAALLERENISDVNFYVPISDSGRGDQSRL